MSLIKRILFLVFIAITIIAAIIGYSYLKNSKKPKVDALTVLPDSCLVYFNTSNFFDLNSKINSQSLIIDKLKANLAINNVVNVIQYLDSVLKTNTDIAEEIENTTIHFATYNQNKKWLSVLNIKQLGNETQIFNELCHIFNTKKTETNYYEFNVSNTFSFLFTIESGVLILSNSSQLITQALNKDFPKLVNNKNFSTYRNNLQESNSLSIYVNHNDYQKNRTKDNINLNVLSNAGLSVGKIDIEPNQIKINGLFNVDDTTNLFYNLYNQQAQTINYIEKLPYSTIEFSSFGFTSFNQLLQKNRITNFWKNINDSALYNLQNDFYENINSQIVSFKLKFGTENHCLIPVIDSLKTFEQMSYMCDSANKVIISKIYKLKKSKLKNAPQLNKLQLFYPYFNAETNFVAFYNSCLYFSTTKEALTTIIDNLKFTNLNFDKNFISYKNQQLSEAYNYVYYTALNNNKNAISDFFTINANYCNNLKHFSYTLSNASTNFKFRCNLFYQTEQINNEQNSIWTTLLDTTSQQQPFEFTNHLTKETEVVIQDDINNLYLINAKGNKIWKKKIKETIQSKIYTVDIFRNNKYQLLFNTKNYLHLIDRNGNYVQGYPVKLPDEATAPLSLLDYDNDKSYRLFISCKNKTIYNYTLYGIKQQGFAPIVTASEVNLPIQYVKVGLSDYIVAVDNMGKIYTYSRKGEARIGLKNKTIENCSAFYVDASNSINSTFLVYVDDKNNLINKISFADKKEIKKLSTTISNAASSFHLIDDNRTMDVLITTANQLLAYDFNGNVIFEKSSDNQLTNSTFYSDENSAYTISLSDSLKKIIITNINQQKNQVINSNTLPLISNLFNDFKKYIIFLNNNQLNCVLLH